MRKINISFLLLAASGPALSQSSTTIYGIADLGARYSNGMNASNAPVASGNTSAVTSGVNNTSRWGLRGQEDLGSGLQAIFQLEGGINLDTGSAAKADKLFDRLAWVGMKNAYGTMQIGRQTNALVDALTPADPLAIRFASFNPNVNVAALSNTAFGTHAFGQQYGTSGYADNFYRIDNMIKVSGTNGPLRAVAAYSVGEVADGSSALSTRGGALIYQQDGLVLSGGVTRFYNRDRLALDAATIGAAFKFGRWQFKTNFAANKADTAVNKSVHQRIASAGISHELTADLLLTTAYYRVRRETTGRLDDGFDRAFVFLEKSMSKRTTLYLESDFTRWRGDAAGKTGALDNDTRTEALTLGLLHKF